MYDERISFDNAISNIKKKGDAKLSVRENGRTRKVNSISRECGDEE